MRNTFLLISAFNSPLKEFVAIMKEVAESFSSPEVGKRHKGELKNVKKDTISVFSLSTNSMF